MKKFGCNIYDYLVVYLSAGLFLLCITMPLPITKLINNLLTDRIRLTANAIRNYGVHLFGNNIEWIGFGGSTDTDSLLASYNFVDSSYLRVLLDNGIIFLVLVLFAYSFFLYKLLIKKQYSILIVLISVLLLSFTEPWLIDVMYNPFVLLGGIVFFRKSKFNDCFQNDGSI